MRSRSYLFLLFVLILTVLSLGLFYVPIRKDGHAFDFKLGLDVVGGARLVYQLEEPQTEAEKQIGKKALQGKVIKILNTRFSGTSEVTIQAKGLDQVVIEIPGEVDIAKAKQLIGTTASLECYWAKNVETAKTSLRRYKPIDSMGSEKKIVVTFTDKFDKEAKALSPDDPETKDQYAQMIKGWELILKGDELAEAYPTTGPRGTAPGMRFSESGARKLEAWSRKYRDEEENIAFVLDGRVISIAPLQKGTILSDSAFINGDFDPAYVRTLCDLLNSGALPVKLNELSTQTVDPTIGKGALNKIVTAGVAAFAVIVAFMLIYYVFPGVIAVLALILYVIFCLSVMRFFVTFSLAAIAGFILSVGMAVDANILVFERTKEEMRQGKPLKSAIDLGFKRALSAIVDSNACTIITSLVLSYYGTGPVKGFAITLIVGVLISLFTAVTVTRSLLSFIVGSGYLNDSKYYGLKRQWFGESIEQGHKPLQIVNKYGLYFAISLAMIIPGIIFYLMGGIKTNVEFQGGIEVEYKLPNTPLTSGQIGAKLLENGIKGANVKLIAGEGRALVTIPKSSLDKVKTNGKFDEEKAAKAAGFTGKGDVTSFYEVGEVVQKEMIWGAINGIIFSSILIVIYLAIRFGVAVGGFVTGLRFSAATIAALLHDILVVIGLAALTGYLFGWEISALFITAMLTMIGFSTHDTIVIFDRIRENLRRPHPNENFANLVNRSISQSFARSINTSGTVIVTLIIMIAFGSATPDLMFFNAAMLVGIISGTYSSIYDASPVLYLIDRAITRWKGSEASLMAISAREIAHIKTISTSVAPSEETSKTVQSDPKASDYGTVKRRRASAVDRSKRNIDDL